MREGEEAVGPPIIGGAMPIPPKVGLARRENILSYL